jgi:hypothetical protein
LSNIATQGRTLAAPPNFNKVDVATGHTFKNATGSLSLSPASRVTAFASDVLEVDVTGLRQGNDCHQKPVESGSLNHTAKALAFGAAVGSDTHATALDQIDVTAWNAFVDVAST